jgi:hypothetical protein
MTEPELARGAARRLTIIRHADQAHRAVGELLDDPD